MPKVFISYRRADSSGWVQLLDERMAPVLGSDNLFCDLRSIRMGREFEQELRARLLECDVVLVVISQNWATIPGRGAKSRLFDTEDLVQLEVALALEAGIEVVPVLCPNVAMPSAQQLPARIRGLLKRQAFPLTMRHLDRDIRDLANDLARLPSRVTAPPAALAAPAKRPRAAAAKPVHEPVTAAETGPPAPAAAPDATRHDFLAPARNQDPSPPPWMSASLAWQPPAPSPAGALGDRPLHLSVSGASGALVFELLHAGEGAPAVPAQSAPAAGLSALRTLTRQVAGSSLNAGQVPEFGAAFYRLLVPSAWRPLVAWCTGLRLLLDEAASACPWEWMWAPNEPLPVSLMRPLLRDGAVDGGPIAPGEITRALVLLGEAPGELFPELPAARAEVQAVAGQLEGLGLEVTKLFELHETSVVLALAGLAFDVVHLSGHSANDWMPKAGPAGEAPPQPLNGLVIGAAAVVSAQDLLLHDRPPTLVTLASDRLGHWVAPLRRAGVHVVLCCDTGLHDEPARSFFGAFYQQLCAGQSVAMALQQARHAALQSNSSDGLVAAVNMQCHGHGDYRWTVAHSPAPATSVATLPRPSPKKASR